MDKTKSDFRRSAQEAEMRAREREKILNDEEMQHANDLQAKANSSQVCVSEFSPSESVNLL